jgi:hypothetical protein
MSRNLTLVVGCAVILFLSPAASVRAADFGTAEEAKAMLERAVAAVKEDKAKALDMFNKGRRWLQGSRPICVVRQRLGRHHNGDTLLE